MDTLYLIGNIVIHSKHIFQGTLEDTHDIAFSAYIPWSLAGEAKDYSWKEANSSLGVIVKEDRDC